MLGFLLIIVYSNMQYKKNSFVLYVVIYRHQILLCLIEGTFPFAHFKFPCKTWVKNI